ncbi:MAG: GAF domain-containing protein [Chitinispirillia bacterium]|nr:GAF domain-containing protein [Chitinispirillia bacterium]MCL2268192.1 GAF domain-containing protein [Chitinispirillia bacterium]
MGQKIIVYGNMPKGDAALVMTLAGHWNLELAAGPHKYGGGLPIGDDRPAGIISYLPCDRETMADAFESRFVDFLENVPAFQMFEGGNPPHFVRDLPLCGLFQSPMTEASAAGILLAINRNRAVTGKRETLLKQLATNREQKDRLAAVGIALCCENEIGALLKLILTVSRETVGADAGCIYIRDRMVDNSHCDTLRFMLCQSDSFKDGAAKQAVLQIGADTLVGCAAFTGQFLEIDDMERVQPAAPFKRDRSFVCHPGYECRSILTMPLKNVEDEVVGVLQLINKKTDKWAVLASSEDVKNYTVPFTTDDIGAVRFLARYAAVSLERISLYRADDA